MILIFVLLFAGALCNEIAVENDESKQAFDSQAAPFWVSRPQSTTVTEGQDAMFDCVVAPVDGESVTWFGPRGTVLAVNDTSRDLHYRINGNYNLVIQAVAPSDEGEYRCVVSRFQSAIAYLYVRRRAGNNTTPRTTPHYQTLTANTTTTNAGCLKRFDQNFGDIYNPGYPSSTNNGNCDYEIYVDYPYSSSILLRFDIFDFDQSRCLSDYLSFEGSLSHGRSFVCRNGTDIVLGRDYYLRPYARTNFIRLHATPGYNSKFKAYFQIIHGFRQTACSSVPCSNYCPMGHVRDIGGCRNTCECEPEYTVEVKTTPEYQPNRVISKSILLSMIRNVVSEGSNLKSLLRDVEHQIQVIKGLLNNNTIVA